MNSFQSSNHTTAKTNYINELVGRSTHLLPKGLSGSSSLEMNGAVPYSTIGRPIHSAKTHHIPSPMQPHSNPIRWVSQA